MWKCKSARRFVWALYKHLLWLRRQTEMVVESIKASFLYSNVNRLILYLSLQLRFGSWER